jgi:hypothetical protein
MSAQQNSSPEQTDYPDNELRDCAKAVAHSINELREKHDIEHDQPVSVYMADKPIIRSMMKSHRDYILEQTNAVDLVQINLDANIPIPNHAPQDDFEIGGQTIRIAIDRD